MDAKQLARIIQQRLGLEDQEFSLVRENPKFQRLFENAAKGARYRLVAEVVNAYPSCTPKVCSHCKYARFRMTIHDVSPLSL
jgi:hypothetical protein